LLLVAVLTGVASARAATAELPPLTDVSGNPRLPGKFVWADLATDNAATARTFYSRLFGWEFRDLGGYSIALSDGRPLAGIFQKPKPADQPDARPRWIGFISVSSVGRAESAVTKAGGKVVAAPAKFPKRGEQAVFADPEGALFGVIRSSGGDPEDFLAEPGEWIWMQLLSRDAGPAAEFYRKVAGYEVVANTTTNRASDFVLTSEGYARATVRTIPDQLSQVKPNWLPFVRVESLTRSVALTKDLGGTVLLAPRPEVLNGRAAVVADPTGGAIGLLEWTPDEKGAR
jgi:predicted enzyme related to lactoylglutathione lyase